MALARRIGQHPYDTRSSHLGEYSEPRIVRLVTMWVTVDCFSAPVRNSTASTINGAGAASALAAPIDEGRAREAAAAGDIPYLEPYREWIEQTLGVPLGETETLEAVCNPGEVAPPFTVIVRRSPGLSE
jgi:hypothetical protein